MNRRDLIAVAAGLISVPRASQAQTKPTPNKIGYIHPRTIAADHATLKILRAAWQRLGYVDGDNVLLRSAGGDIARIPALVNELVDLGAGVLIVVGAATIRSASRATRTTAIVGIDLETDPVRAGYAASFARPGGNVTGLFLDQPSIAGKWIDLLRDAVPDIQRLVILWDASTGVDQLEIAKAAARSKALEPVLLELGAIGSFDSALRGMSGKPRTGIVLLASAGFALRAADFAATAQKYGLPAISILKTYAEAGVFMSYGPVQEAYFGRAVVLADKVLKGEKPGEIPIEGPDRFEFVLNLKTAKAMGLKLPTSLLLLADDVIR